MIESIYRERVALLLKMIPYVAKEEIFGLKGGTAINLFLRDFPRLSVDIDLVYLPIDSRDTALDTISQALLRVKEQVEKEIPDIHVTPVPITEGHDVKLICQINRAQVKIEVNTVSRGHTNPVSLKRISKKVEVEFEQFAAMQLLSDGEIYGSKICAALDRQHPRDLFDVRLLLDAEGITDETKYGFICSLLSHPRPLHEVIKPRHIDQADAFESQFSGMSFIPFSYADYEATREELFKKMNSILTDLDKRFLCSFKGGRPDWSLDKNYEQLQVMPAIQWKLMNIQKLKKMNPNKHQQMLGALFEKMDLLS